MGKIKDFLIRISQSGYKEAVYDNFKEEITLQNRRLVETTSFIGSIIMILLTITSLFLPAVSKVMPLYFATAVAFLIIFLLVRGEKHKSDGMVLLCNYGFLLAAFFFALGLDIIQKNPTATTVCVLLVALPLLVIDKPFREVAYFLFVAICFMCETAFIKQSPKASVDILNAVSFLIVGLFLGYKHNQMVLRNITGHSLLEQERDMDNLTTLLNKGALERRAVAYLREPDMKASMIVIDMDNFKYVNDTYGHHSGDEILIQIGQLLKSLFRENDLLGRFGGDEFVVFLPMSNDKKLVSKRAEAILDGVKEIRIGENDEYRAHVCLGVTLCPKDGSSYDELFRHADEAMYMVKRNGKNGYGFYDANSKQSILIVDDIKMNRSILRKTLEDDYDILEAVDGKHALEILEKEQDIAAVITDIQMPNMDGIELIRRIRGNQELRDIALIANTQYGDMKQEEQMFQLGVDDFVYKAASPRIIQMRVKNVLKAKK